MPNTLRSCQNKYMILYHTTGRMSIGIFNKKYTDRTSNHISVNVRSVKHHIDNHSFRAAKASLSVGIGAGFAKQNRCFQAANYCKAVDHKTWREKFIFHATTLTL